jgi:hypothetical protein
MGQSETVSLEEWSESQCRAAKATQGCVQQSKLANSAEPVPKELLEQVEDFLAD